MSIRVMTQVWDSGQYSGSKLLLLLALADFAHDDGDNIYPTVDTLVQKTRCDRRTVQRNLRQLEGEGAIRLVRPASRHGPAEYQIGAAFCRPSGDEGRYPVPSGAASDANQGRRDAAQTVIKEPLKEPLKETKNARERARVKDLKEEFGEWYQHYPRKVARGAAEKAFATVWREGAELADLIAGAKRYAAQVAGKETEYIKHPATWLNAECWLDEPDPPPKREPSWWEKRERAEREEEERQRGGRDEKGGAPAPV